MRRDFVNEVGRIQQIKRVDLVEKDLILHQMLLDLSNDKLFSENFVFKGGTCLIKHYRDYVELGGGNKTCTFKIWYQSEVLGRRSFMKIQINFVERLYFPSRK